MLAASSAPIRAQVSAGRRTGSRGVGLNESLAISRARDKCQERPAAGLFSTVYVLGRACASPLMVADCFHFGRQPSSALTLCSANRRAGHERPVMVQVFP